MAKRNPEQEPRPEKAKVRVFFAEVEGSNDSVREALKTMVAAMNRPQPVAPARLQSNGNGQAAIPAELEEQLEEDLESEQPGVTTEAAETPVGRRPRGTGPKRDYNAGVDLVHDVDFVPQDKEPLRTFFTDKTPGTDMEQVLVLVYYMQHILELTGITLGHVRTAFKHVEKPMPADLRKTVRNMKKDKAWLSSSAPDDVTVSTIGDRVVEHELGKKSDA